MKKNYWIFLLIVLFGFGVNGSAAKMTQETIVPNPADMKMNINDLTTKVFKQGKAMAEIITWHDESTITILLDGRIVFRKAFFSPLGYNGSFIEEGAWSPDGSYFAFRLLSSGGHMPYRTPVKIFRIDEGSGALLDAEDIIQKIPNISNIAVGPYKEPYILWLSDTSLQVSVVSQNKKSDSGMYVIDLHTLTAKKKNGSVIPQKHTPHILSAKERRDILDALRKTVKERLNLDVIFVVEYLKSKENWVYIHTLPQSKDGKNHYEDISALLTKKEGIWSVLEIPCTEEEPGCLSDPDYFLNLKNKFPDLPDDILPQE